MTDKHVPQSARLPQVNYAVYTVGDMGSAIYALVPSILLMFYMTNILGIPVAFATTAILVPRIVEILSTPIIAGLSDHTRTRLGRRRPYMLVGALAALPTFGAMWLSPFTDPAKSAWFILATFTICAAFFPSFIVGFYALNAELPRDYHDRTRLNSFRTAYTYVGLVLAGAGAPLIVQLAGGGRLGYRYMGLIIGAVMTVVTFVSFLSAREPPACESERAPTILEAFQAMRGNRPYQLLFFSYFIYITSLGLFSAVLAYFVTYILGRGASFLSFLFFVKYGTAVIATPLWSWFSRRIGKLATLQICLALILTSSLVYLFVKPETPTWVILASLALYGASGAGVNVLTFSMLADCIQHGNDKPGALTSGGMFTGIFLAGEKLGFAAGALVSGVILGVTGFVETTQGSVVQPPSAIEGIRFSLSIMQFVLLGISVVALVLYRPFERSMVARNGLASR